MKPFNLRAGLRALAALLLAATAAGAAHGQVYKGSWDPAYGAPFGKPTLGWRGEITFEVKNCTGTGLVAMTGTCTAMLTDTLIEFYLVSEKVGQVTEPTRAKITYTTVKPIRELLFTGSVLKGIATDLFEYQPLVFEPGSQADDLFDGKEPMFALDFNIEDPYNGPLLCWSRAAVNADFDKCNNSNTKTGAFVPNMKIELQGAVLDVPEPGSLALVFGGLLAATGIGRLRRRRG